jgi:hypothetical protein
MKYMAFLGNEDVLYSGESGELSEKVHNFLMSVADTNGSTGTFEIIEEVINTCNMYFISVHFPAWAEGLFLIQFYEYSWELLEESE